MSIKYLKVKKIVLPFLTLVILTATITGKVLLSSNEVAEISSECPEVVVEVIDLDDNDTSIKTTLESGETVVFEDNYTEDEQEALKIVLFNNTFDTAHEDNRLPAEYDAWTNYELVVMHNLVSEGEFNLDGITLEELDSAYLLWREENYAEAEDKLFERVNGLMGSPYFVIDQSGSDVYNYFGDIDSLEVVDHIEYNKGVIVISKGLESTSADGWVKAHIYIWDADVNKSVLVTVYVETKNIGTEKGPAIEVKEEQPIVTPAPTVVDPQPTGTPYVEPDPAPVSPEPQSTNRDGGVYDDRGNFYPGGYRDENGVLRDFRGAPISEDNGVRSGDLQDGTEGHDYSDIVGA